MKCTLIIAVTVVSSVVFTKAAPIDPVEDRKQREIWGLECLKETSADKAIIDQAQRTPLNLPNDEKYKQFLACSYKKQGYQDRNGKMLYNNIKEFLSRFYTESDLKILDNCHQISGLTDAETAFNHLVCMMQKLDTLTDKESLNNNV